MWLLTAPSPTPTAACCCHNSANVLPRINIPMYIRIYNLNVFVSPNFNSDLILIHDFLIAFQTRHVNRVENNIYDLFFLSDLDSFDTTEAGECVWICG